mgnify:FL=1
MSHDAKASSLILGIFICAGLVAMAWILGASAIRFKEYDRIVSVNASGRNFR